MSAICGYAGSADPAVLGRMLTPVGYRGDRSGIVSAAGVGFGYRFWSGRAGKSDSIAREGDSLGVMSGSFAPAIPSPAATLGTLWTNTARLATLDGNFAAAYWDGARRRLTLARDPFGVRALYYVEHDGTFYFASELKQLLAIPGLPVEMDALAIHKYLTFSFVPGEDVPIRGIKRLLPGRIATFEDGRLTITPYFTLAEAIDPALEDQQAAVRLIREQCEAAVARRLNGETKVALFLSGGLDSSGVGVWLKKAGVEPHAFSLDFGAFGHEKAQAEEVAEALGVGLTFVRAEGDDVAAILTDLVWKLDLPFGDAVTGPQYLLSRAARAAGYATAFNGEGGDQLFGGWTSKPMISAQLYAGLLDGDTREETYLKSYHRFHGLEDELYTPEFRAAVGPPGTRRAVLAPYLNSQQARTFLNRVRLADISLKGSQNILPRMDRTAQAHGVDIRAPLFDRALAEASFRLPTHLKLHGASEKHVLKLALQTSLPHDIVWRRKYGMGVPVTQWTLGPMREHIEDLLGPDSLRRRGLFQEEYVTRLRLGQNAPDEIRRRRIGERLWTLAMLEAWLRIFIDGRGREPGSVA